MRQTRDADTNHGSPHNGEVLLPRAGGLPGRGFPAVGELAQVIGQVLVKTGAETGLLAFSNQATGPVDVVCACGVAERNGHLPPAASAIGRTGLVGRVLESGVAALEPLDPEDDQGLTIAVPGARPTYAAGAPVRPPGGGLGALCVGFSAAPHENRAMIMWLIEQYAALAALCMHDADALDGVLGTARLDGLTGCLNEATLHAELDRMVGRCARRGGTVSCCFIDLDGFKLINDRHGHLHGSRVLTAIAAALRASMRGEDALGRYGGDEFVALLPDTDEAAACAFAERLRSTISSTLSKREHSGSLDASIGVAQWQPGWAAGELLEAADSALLNAKRTGGGKVVPASVSGGRSQDRTMGANGGDLTTDREPVRPATAGRTGRALRS
jgi:diguanylate cyclase (GGDEF)-like protein